VTSWGGIVGETSTINDTGSLQNLNDIVVPGAVPWWPPATGWYVLAAIAAVGLAVLAVRWLRYRRSNRYRKQALLELALIRKNGSQEAMQQLPGLLKRAALSAWPREEVASLSGHEWHRFLDDSAATDRFSSGAGAALDRIAYASGPAATPAGPEEARVLEAAEFWLKSHVNRAGSG
jgi:hypothetical protein